MSHVILMSYFHIEILESLSHIFPTKFVQKVKLEKVHMCFKIGKRFHYSWRNARERMKAKTSYLMKMMERKMIHPLEEEMPKLEKRTHSIEFGRFIIHAKMIKEKYSGQIQNPNKFMTSSRKLWLNSNLKRLNIL